MILPWTCIQLLLGLCGASLASNAPFTKQDVRQKTQDGDPLPVALQQLLGPSEYASQNPIARAQAASQASFSLYANSLDAIEVMQSHFFSIAHGTWPNAIDWTAAVMGMQVSATLFAISDFLPSMKASISEVGEHENIINRYFSQLSTFYFGENAFSLRNQAYDDMLWVVLDWLEAIKFINKHSSLMETNPSSKNKHNGSEWYGRQFIPQFAHRSRIFYDLASKGWDTKLCGGGMTWNHYVAPYKNAITNELFIAASISMYLYFPGDQINGPFMTQEVGAGGLPTAKAHDKKYLQNAIKGYEWLKGSEMMNIQGLYVDGFHITGWRSGVSNGTGKCDARNEMVYTYNQGVVLTGLRGLWEATGEEWYLADGHELIQNVIAATGWQERDKPGRWRWAGLGRNGVLEDLCDRSGRCSQNGQTFKGIFFHHFSYFCAPLSKEVGDETRPWLIDGEVGQSHQRRCEGYGGWVSRNAEAATTTKDGNGEFGQWWGCSASDKNDNRVKDMENQMPWPDGERTDYRNLGVPRDDIWRSSEADEALFENNLAVQEARCSQFNHEAVMRHGKPIYDKDINDRGRGRTVETQSGGLAVVRAAWRLMAQSLRGGQR